MTGATGFLGSNLLRQLIKKKYGVIILKRSFSNIDRIKDLIKFVKSFNLDQVSIKDIFKKINIDIILHCATNYGRVDTDPFAVIDANLLLPLKLLETGKKNNIKYFINTDTILDKRINYYTLSKSQFKDWLKMYSEGLVCINLLLEHFYGPFDDKTKFISFILDKLLTNAAKIDLTEGRQKRDFIYIDDVVDAFIKVLENLNNLQFGIYNYEIGTNKSLEIRKVVELIKKISGNTITRFNFGIIPYRKNEIMDSKADTEAIRNLGWKSKYSLIQGLVKTINKEKGLKEA
jgi:nucleoside-diphosphate-sugar epimerase